jgi:hypothetical protein
MWTAVPHAVVRAAAIAALAYPLVWVVFGAYASSPTDVPPLGLMNPDLPLVEASNAYIPLAGWIVLGLVFLVSVLVSVVAGRRGFGPRGEWTRLVELPLVLVGVVALMLGVSLAIQATPLGRTTLNTRSGGICIGDPTSPNYPWELCRPGEPTPRR